MLKCCQVMNEEIEMRDLEDDEEIQQAESLNIDPERKMKNGKGWIKRIKKAIKIGR